MQECRWRRSLRRLRRSALFRVPRLPVPADLLIELVSVLLELALELVTGSPDPLSPLVGVLRLHAAQLLERAHVVTAELRCALAGLVRTHAERLEGASP